MVKKMNHRGQSVAIWVIIAVVLLAVLVLFFTLEEREVIDIIPRGVEEFSPELMIKQCTEEYVNEAVDIMLPRGGFLNPQNFRMYNSTPIEYLCDNSGYYDPCVNQHPVLIHEMEQEIYSYISPKIDECFDDLKSEVEKQGGLITMSVGIPTVNVELGQDRIFVKIEKGLTITEKDQTRTFYEFDVEVNDPLYNLAMVAMEIANQEAEYCYFEYTGFNAFYPRYIIKPYSTSDPTTIYSIVDTKSGRAMNIAIRSCAIPSGI